MHTERIRGIQMEIMEMMTTKDVQVQIDVTLQMLNNGRWDKQVAFKYLDSMRKMIMCLGREDENKDVKQILKKTLLELNSEASI